VAEGDVVDNTFLMKKIFISYSDYDKSKMRSLEKKLKNSDQLVTIIIADKRQTMTSLSEKVIRGINEADYVVPILTKQSIATQWINQEIGFAQAMGKNIRPVVDQLIMAELRGFIHSQIDLPYNYKSQPDQKKERKAFRKCCDILLEDILADFVQPAKTEETVTLSDIFIGKWMNNYVLPKGEKGKEVVEIQNGNRYYSNDRFVFLLDKIQISHDRQVIKFRKNGVNGDNRTAFNNLKLIKPGVYSGQEEECKVTYSKISDE
jgi:hypothetical protein